jgi:hypothetical protein
MGEAITCRDQEHDPLKGVLHVLKHALFMDVDAASRIIGF